MTIDLLNGLSVSRISALQHRVVSKERPMPHPIDGRWRISEMELWYQKAIDLVGPGYFYFDSTNRTSKFQFIAVEGFMDCRFSERGGIPAVEFSWEGNDELDPASGRGWAILEDSVLKGRIFIHQGDDSGFTAVPMRPEGG